jgi:ribosomal protein S18 acetylase RimI-like enzyme
MAQFRVVHPAGRGAQWALEAYFAEIGAVFGFQPGTAFDDAVTAFAPPGGVFLLAGSEDSPIACGAVQFLDDERGEIKRMWVAPEARGQGLAGQLLARLEEEIVSAGRRVALLDTNSSLTKAVGLYESRGYVRVPDYNGNPDADVWFSKPLATS